MPIIGDIYAINTGEDAKDEGPVSLLICVDKGRCCWLTNGNRAIAVLSNDTNAYWRWDSDTLYLSDGDEKFMYIYVTNSEELLAIAKELYHAQDW